MNIRYWKPATAAMLVAWLCFSVAQFFWVLLGRPLPGGGTASPAAPAVENKRPAPVDLDALMMLSFAGSDDAPQIYTEAAPQATGLNLVLRGAIPSSDPAAAKAIIADGDRQGTFATGETLTLGPGGISLVAVMSDRVTLDNNGRHETLWMYQHSEPNPATSAPNVSATDMAATVPAPPAAAVPENVTTVPSLPSLPGLTAVLEVIGGPVSGAMASTLGNVASVSVQQDGAFRIRAKDDGRLFRRLGLRNDDVVTAINDVPVQDTGNALAMYRSLAGETRVKLAIVRNGEPVSVLVDLAALNDRGLNN